jgi:energy-coupling factor transporter ATP-binding protein EcfA2
MLGLKLRTEFAGRKLTGTTIDFTNRQGSGALDRAAKDFLSITYPSTDVLKTLEAVQPGKAQPVVIIGARGQGKSHLMAALSHMFNEPTAGEEWLNDWASKLKNDALTRLCLRTNLHVIAESLHLQNYKFLWDMLFANHPEGTYVRGKWEGRGENKTDVPGYALMLEMFKKQPTMLILDEFQTWFEG